MRCAAAERDGNKSEGFEWYVYPLAFLHILAIRYFHLNIGSSHVRIPYMTALCVSNSLDSGPGSEFSMHAHTLEPLVHAN